MIASIAHDVAGWIGAPTIVIVLALVGLRFYLMRRRVMRKRAQAVKQHGTHEARSGEDGARQ